MQCCKTAKVGCEYTVGIHFLSLRTSRLTSILLLASGVALPTNYEKSSGKMAAGVDYSRPIEMTYLACPNPSDSLATVEAKMKAIDRVVAEGKSVAVYMGYLDGHTMDTAEEVEAAVVAHELTSDQRLLYTSWKNGSAFHSFDFERSVIDVTHDATASVRYARLVQAMNIVWDTDKATPGNAAYVSLYKQHLFPLLLAVKKIEAAKNESRWGFPRDPSAMDKVEAETIWKVNDIASKVMNEELQRVRASARHVVESKSILMARKRALNDRTRNEADDSSTFPNTMRPQQQEQQHQRSPRSLGERPLPKIPTIDLTGDDTSDVMPATPSTNKRATQHSEDIPAFTQRKFMKMTVKDDSTLGTQKGVGSASTPGMGTGATPQNFEASSTTQRQHTYANPGVNYAPVTDDEGDAASTLPATRATTQTSNVPPRKNYMKPSVRDATDSDDGN